MNKSRNQRIKKIQSDGLRVDPGNTMLPIMIFFRWRSFQQEERNLVIKYPPELDMRPFARVQNCKENWNNRSEGWRNKIMGSDWNSDVLKIDFRHKSKSDFGLN